jgi:hypothetical protein
MGIAMLYAVEDNDKIVRIVGCLTRVRTQTNKASQNDRNGAANRARSGTIKTFLHSYQEPIDTGCYHL